MAGFSLPITMFTPQQLAEMARAAFRPPALMGGGGGGGGLSGGGGAAAPGFNAQDAAGAAGGIGALAKSLMADKGVSGMPETAAVGPGGLSGAVSSIDALQPSAGGTWTPPPMPTNIGFGGGAADGGPVMPGKYYTVGERGPETFVPTVPGYIVPNEERYYAPPSRELDSPAPFSRERYLDSPTPFSRERYLDNYERDFFGGRRRK